MAFDIGTGGQRRHDYSFNLSDEIVNSKQKGMKGALMVLWILLIMTVITLLIGIPIAFSLGISSSVAIIFMGGVPYQIIAQKIYSGMDSFPLLCIPFFILAGEIMSNGKITESLLEFSILIIGRLRGGLAMANVVASMFFGGMTGSAIADTSALGSVEIPMMIKSGYGKRFSAAITCASAMVGPVIPPSIPVVIYALSVGGTSIGGLFLAGVIPGILLGISLMMACYIISRKRKYPILREKFSFKIFLKSFIKVFPVLVLPIIIVGGIIFGIFTPTEASAVAVGYAFIITVIVKKTVRLKDMPKMLIHSGVTTAIVMIIVGTSTLWGWVVAIEQLSETLASMLQNSHPLVFLLMVNIFLLLLGTVMDNIPVILIFAPTLAPIAIELGIDPLHFGMVFCVNTTLGLITPPLGE
ncbi:MAG: TRAP transporter large permease, partial [Methanosarcinaceae archaeon]|nr:TRAP transporter large permease [Methanosarcinaceae archaeon]